MPTEAYSHNTTFGIATRAVSDMDVKDDYWRFTIRANISFSPMQI
jgi:hypothetical protein